MDFLNILGITSFHFEILIIFFINILLSLVAEPPSSHMASATENFRQKNNKSPLLSIC